MITITLNKIRKHGPCKEGWETLLKHLGKTGADDEVFPFKTIIESNGLDDAIWALRCLEDERVTRLFIVGCCQNIMHLMRDDRSVDAVMVSHLYAHGEATENELDAARSAAWSAAARDAARDAAWDAAWAAARDAAWAAARSAAARDAAWDAARVRQKELLEYLCDNYENEEY